MAACELGSAIGDEAGALKKIAFTFLEILADTDTTSTSITYLFWELGRCLDIMKGYKRSSI